MPPRLHSCSVPPEAQSSIPACLPVATPTSRLQISMPPYLHTSPSLHLQRASRASYLYTSNVSTSARLYRASRASEPSTSLRLQRASRIPELHTSMPPSLHAHSAPPALHTSTSARLQCVSRPPDLHAFTSAPCSAPPSHHKREECIS